MYAPSDGEDGPRDGRTAATRAPSTKLGGRDSFPAWLPHGVPIPSPIVVTIRTPKRCVGCTPNFNELVHRLMFQVEKVGVGYLLPLVTTWRELKNLIYAHVLTFVGALGEFEEQNWRASNVRLVLQEVVGGNGDRSC